MLAPACLNGKLEKWFSLHPATASWLLSHILTIAYALTSSYQIWYHSICQIKWMLFADFSQSEAKIYIQWLISLTKKVNKNGSLQGKILTVSEAQSSLSLERSTSSAVQKEATRREEHAITLESITFWQMRSGSFFVVCIFQIKVF